MKKPIPRVTGRPIPRPKRPLPINRINHPNFTRNRAANKLQKEYTSFAPWKINILRLKPGLGDILMLTPALLGLREKFPFAHLSLTVKQKYDSDTRPTSKDNVIYEAVKNLPYVDYLRAWEVDGPGLGYDFSVDISSAAGEISYEKRATKSPERIDIWNDYLGGTPSSKVPYLVISPEETAWATNLLKERGVDFNNKLVLIMQNSNTAFRDAPVATLQRVAQQLRSQPGVQPIVVSEIYKENWNIPGVLEFRSLTPRQFFALAAVVDLIITPDTGALAVAGALNKKIVGLWGPSHPQARTSYYKNIINLWHKDLCNIAPCWYSNHSCANRVCINTISVQEIVHATNTLLERPQVTIPTRHNYPAIFFKPYAPTQEYIYELKRIVKFTSMFDYKIFVPYVEESEKEEILKSEHGNTSKVILFKISPGLSDEEVFKGMKEQTIRTNILLLSPFVRPTVGWLGRLMLGLDNSKEGIVIPTLKKITKLDNDPLACFYDSNLIGFPSEKGKTIITNSVMEY